MYKRTPHIHHIHTHTHKCTHKKGKRRSIIKRENNTVKFFPLVSAVHEHSLPSLYVVFRYCCADAALLMLFPHKRMYCTEKDYLRRCTLTYNKCELNDKYASATSQTHTHSDSNHGNSRKPGKKYYRQAMLCYVRG